MSDRRGSPAFIDGFLAIPADLQQALASVRACQLLTCSRLQGTLPAFSADRRDNVVTGQVG
jgi:hypothetical protein